MFKIIIPVYNVEEYLKEAVDSVIAQSLPFSDNVKIYLIDDNSTDGSLSICKEYKEKYPDNIFVEHFETNRGVSYARNYGLELAREDDSDIIMFLDSDDKLGAKALELAKKFFEEHPDIYMATTERFFFDAEEGPHKANWRFEDREVVDINIDFNYPQYFVGGLFLKGKASALMHFDEKMDFWEDTLAVNEVLIEIKKYGLIKGAIYFYRRREKETSLVDKAWNSKERYNKFLKTGYLRLMKYCKKKTGSITPYIQFVVAYHLRIFLLANTQEKISKMIDEKEMPKFKKRLRKVLKKIDDDIILSINTRMPIREALLSLKYGEDIRMDSEYKDGDIIVSYKGKELDRLSEKGIKIIGWLDKEGYEGMLRGRFSSPIYEMKEEDCIFAEHDGERVQSVRYKCKKQIYALDMLIRDYKYAGFAIDIPEEWETLRWGIQTKDGEVLLNEYEIERE